jgi:hypothetical protein
MLGMCKSAARLVDSVPFRLIEDDPYPPFGVTPTTAGSLDYHFETLNQCTHLVTQLLDLPLAQRLAVHQLGDPDIWVF